MLLGKNLKFGIIPYRTSITFTNKYSVKPQATPACKAPTIGRVLNSVFWLMKIAKPRGQFLIIARQSKGSVPLEITLNIRENVVKDKVIDSKTNARKATRSKPVSIC